MAKQIKLKCYESLYYYEEQLKKLDMQVGECYAAFGRDHDLSAMWVVCEWEDCIGGGKVCGVRCVKVLKRGFSRIDKYINKETLRFDAYTHIVQVDRKRFDTLDKAIGLLNAQINAYQGEFKNLIEE